MLIKLWAPKQILQQRIILIISKLINGQIVGVSARNLLSSFLFHFHFFFISFPLHFPSFLFLQLPFLWDLWEHSVFFTVQTYRINFALVATSWVHLSSHIVPWLDRWCIPALSTAIFSDIFCSVSVLFNSSPASYGKHFPHTSS